ncbi:hypothetical protein DK847_07910 [Aestuariivirga litoralis]|uniref:Uncharacterized protein n=1 Tax=Aestuariivirga litoralis TaxID=2650924 RepID=A0A2W2CAN2_9HYPH|nr:hypothetical protein DK847_07910 [Aestuariivirga litoralis]
MTVSRKLRWGIQDDFQVGIFVDGHFTPRNNSSLMAGLVPAILIAAPKKMPGTSPGMMNMSNR